MSFNQKLLSLCLYFIIAAYSSNGSASPQALQPSDDLQFTSMLSSIKGSWKELLLQLERRNKITTLLVNHIDGYSNSEVWKSLMIEIRQSSQETVAFSGEPEAIKNSEAYSRFHQAETKLAAAFTKLPSADQLKNSLYIDFRVMLESVETRIYVEKFRLTRLLMKKDDCLVTAADTGDIAKFCSAIKIDLEQGGCTTNYQPLVVGDICQ